MLISMFCFSSFSFRYFFSLRHCYSFSPRLFSVAHTHPTDEFHYVLFFSVSLWNLQFNLCYHTSSIIHYGTRNASALYTKPICYCVHHPHPSAQSVASTHTHTVDWIQNMFMMCVNFVHLFWIWFIAQWTQFTRPCERIDQPCSRCRVSRQYFLELGGRRSPLHRSSFFGKQNKPSNEGTIDSRGHFVNGWFFDAQIYWSMNSAAQRIAFYR